MFSSEIFTNLELLILCYVYILLIILISGKMSSIFQFSRKSSRKFLHIMIGNLPFIIPFFSYNSFPLNFPFFVAAPFILITFLTSPYSPSKRFSEIMKGLSGITEEGHQLGLIFYALSYTLLALFFSDKPLILAAGILPMAYGDAFAAIVGEKYGRRRFKIFAKKSLEGSAAMFLTSLISFASSVRYFSIFYPLQIINMTATALGVALTATLAESLSPRGFDNITVPILSALTFIALSGGA
ncbi:phosphatidate cytidylyltransferase [Candidatus Bathyarchaeota archaeon]|nr:phosphatidate cytidylyltransferase [Candidatus Bathyarchaeota archaeon]